MIEKSLKNFYAAVDFCAEGADCESFLTFCAKNGIEIIDPRKTGYVFFGSVRAKDYKKLRKPAKKAGLKLKILKKRGLYFSLKRKKDRIGFAAGIIFITVIMLIMNLFIWDITVSGNSKIKTEDIIDAAEKSGLFCGTFAAKHDTQVMEWAMLNEIEGLASVEINIQGSRATIIVNEAFDEAEMKSDDDVPVNIIASRYGVIRRMDVFDGQDSVKPGDAVMKGDLLVSAVYEDRHNKLTLKHARAVVIAETDYSIKAEFPLEQITREQGALKKTVTDYEILGIDIFHPKNEKYQDMIIETEEKGICFFWIELPIKMNITRYFAVKEKTVTYNFEQARDGAFALLAEKEKSEMENIEIISRTVEEKIKNGKYILDADYICLMDIAEEQPLYSDVPWENTDDMS